jgi:hypothetical protein
MKGSFLNRMFRQPIQRLFRNIPSTFSELSKIQSDVLSSFSSGIYRFAMFGNRAIKKSRTAMVREEADKCKCPDHGFHAAD